MAGLQQFILAALALVLSGCVSYPRYSLPPGCNPHDGAFGDHPDAICFFPASVFMPSLIDHPVLRLAVIPMDKNDLLGLPQSVREEISSLMESATHSLKNSFPRLEIVERAHIDVAIKELAFQGRGLVRDDSFVGAGHMLGADHVLVYRVAVNLDGGMPHIQRRGGAIRGIASGKLIRVQTGTVDFQQTARREAFVGQLDSGAEWTRATIEGIERATVLGALDSVVDSLNEAMLPSPIGIFWDTDPGDSRVKVTEIFLGGPASNAGIRRGDFIIAVDGIPVRSSIDDRVLEDLEITPRELVQITIQRNGQEQTFAVRPLKPSSIKKSLSPAKP